MVDCIAAKGDCIGREVIHDPEIYHTAFFLGFRGEQVLDPGYHFVVEEHPAGRLQKDALKDVLLYVYLTELKLEKTAAGIEIERFKRQGVAECRPFEFDRRNRDEGAEIG